MLEIPKDQLSGRPLGYAIVEYLCLIIFHVFRARGEHMEHSPAEIGKIVLEKGCYFGSLYCYQQLFQK